MQTKSVFDISQLDLDDQQGWIYTFTVDIGPWYAPKIELYKKIIEWCLQNFGSHNVKWRAYRPDFKGKLLVQLKDISDAIEFGLTWE